MNQKEKIDQIKQCDVDPKEAISMILSVNADMGSDIGVLLSVKQFDLVADMIIEYFDLPTKDTIKALEAAIAFIDSHAGDPDITSEMVETYAKYRAALEKLHGFKPKKKYKKGGN